MNNACSTSLYDLFAYIPVLGFILRSTNSRLAFEVHGPLLRIARRLIADTTRLLISSEWDYSPFVYLPLDPLPDFVLVGLPATESSNPLLLPLAGHELGHHVWRIGKLEDRFRDKITEIIIGELTSTKWAEYNSIFPDFTKADLNTNILAQQTWAPAYTWAAKQAEEVFCDFLGIRVFGESYLHAFSYLLAPGTEGERSMQYPNIERRVGYMAGAAQAMGLVVPTGFADEFQKENEPTDPARSLLIGMADTAVSKLTGDLTMTVSTHCKKQSIPTRDLTEVARISHEFSHVIAPAGDIRCLADIVNAGWNCFHSEKLWDDCPQIRPDDKDRILADLVLKTIDVFEFEQRVSE